MVLTPQLALYNMPGAPHQQKILVSGFSGELGEKCMSLVQVDSHPGHQQLSGPRGSWETWKRRIHPSLGAPELVEWNLRSRNPSFQKRENSV